MPDFGTVDLLKPNEKEYSLDVMQTFSKNFTELQEHFDKVTKQISTPAQETAAAAAVKVVEETEVPKVLRIKSVHTVYNTPQPQPPLPPEVSSPSGTVARLEIFTDKANDKTTFTVMPPQGSQTSGQSSVSVQTSDLSKATKLLKPVHLERLPLLQKILFSAGRKGGNGDDEMSGVPKRQDLFLRAKFVAFHASINDHEDHRYSHKSSLILQSVQSLYYLTVNPGFFCAIFPWA